MIKNDLVWILNLAILGGGLLFLFNRSIGKIQYNIKSNKEFRMHKTDDEVYQCKLVKVKKMMRVE